ncbi:MAG: bifunctional DNA-binding transcriptional regulator/O6-methylguanine-DNA methyltransferase Ada [Deltaproteobacteria bacterium]|nr:bifunctional DNA-binding transcriptional regulator/O6-methylguanine-DNA methyltransferase Ada [Nannocystaceae bacterium]
MITATSTYATAEHRWRAVVDRDDDADGRFVYAVQTTGVFCRPSCSSRSPLRRNVEFYASPREAERAGYRACLRCHPSGEDPKRQRAATIVAACRRLEADEAPRNDELARELGVSPFYFQRLFKQHTGVTPQAYRRRVLAERARASLPGAATVTAAVYDAGYGSSSRFYDNVGRELGMTPAIAKRAALGETVHYAVRRCSLGRVLVAWTERGVCHIALGDRELALVEALQARFARAELHTHDALPAWFGALLDAIDTPRALELPLDIRGTAFQQRVWDELRRIPVGETRSYAEVAAALGAPSSSRAVARACASNTIAVVIPCHRVVRSDGSLSGYRWGEARKRRLLERERTTR